MEPAENEDPATLQPDIPWLSDTYRPRLQQEEKDKHPALLLADKTDSFVLCSKDHIESYAEHRLLSALSGHQGSHAVHKPRRPTSGQGTRQLGHVRETQVPVEWQGWAWEVAESEGAEELKDRAEYHQNGFAEDYEKGQENMDKGHALWLAAKRKHAVSSSVGSRPSSARGAPSRPTTPSSGTAVHVNSSSLPPRSSSAMAGLSSNGVLHPGSSAATLRPNDDSLPSRPSSPMCVRVDDSDSQFLRPSSAMARPSSAMVRPSSAMVRPSSAMVRPSSPMARPSSPMARPSSPTARLSSAMSQRSGHNHSKPPPSFRAGAAARRPRSAAVYTRRELTQQREPQRSNRPSSASAAAGDAPTAAAAASSSSSPRPPSGRVDPYTALRDKRFRSLQQAWMQDPRSGLHIGVGGGAAVGPSPHLMDRHVRCLDHHSWAKPPPPPPPPPPQHHHDDLPERPHTSCGVMRGMDGEREEGFLSPEHQQQEKEEEEERMRDWDGMSRVQRYIDCHRPASAPRMRKELEGTFRRSANSSLGTRGRSPHFCNFVQKAGLHARYDTGHARTGSGSDEEGGRVSLASEATDHDIWAQWRKSRPTNSGTEGRPGSPSSVDGKSRDAHVTSAHNGVASEDEDALSAKPIPTINIPSSPIPAWDQLLSNRSSGESSPRKSAREESKRQPDITAAEKSPKPQQLAVSLPTPPPKEEKKTAEKTKRLPVSKKSRKGGDRLRKSKTVTMQEPLPSESSASGDPNASGDAESQPATNGLDVSAKVPDLPEVSTSDKKNDRQGKKAQRRLIATSPAGGDKLQLPQELLDLDASSKTGYDFGDMETTLADSYNNKYRPQSWLNTRMALSQQASRFELPMDMKVLEEITPQNYLRQFCVVTSRRTNLYQKIFVKHKDKNHTINMQGLETCLRETLVQQMKDTTFADLCHMLDIADSTVIDFKLFAGIAAITERILYPHYTTEDTVEKAEYQRERIETADFSALDWKLHGIKVGAKMKQLLKTIE